MGRVTSRYRVSALLAMLGVAALLLASTASATQGVQMPDVKSKGYVSAVVTLTRAHLCVTVHLLATASPSSLALIRKTALHPGVGVRVIRQDPASGTSVRQWSYVTITVPQANLPFDSTPKSAADPCRPIVPRVITR